MRPKYVEVFVPSLFEPSSGGFDGNGDYKRDGSTIRVGRVCVVLGSSAKLARHVLLAIEQQTHAAILAYPEIASSDNALSEEDDDEPHTRDRALIGEILRGVQHASFGAEGGRPLVIRTQHPCVLDSIWMPALGTKPEDAAEQISRLFVVCEKGRADNLGLVTASAVWRTYENGVLHVSEVLAHHSLF